ncbi:uncharacterized protein LOC107267301 [Cephus cinctus]|uniref:Uncharacterized protein LOC107267301 n=1 Tax=Cephus cinctus TaxID=211228 RepID=A0AAJ7RH68_CEPCN|nr:uncharacterized protein LOC107267301 [Cephus cinctus]
MLLLHSIIFLGALLLSSRASSNPYIIVAQPEQEESNDVQWISENFGVEDLPGETADTKVCQSEECRRTAQEFLRNLNKSVDPCEDFYEYACGGWSQRNHMPAKERIWNQLTKIERWNKKRIRGILEEPEEDSDLTAVKAAKRFHQSCMDLDAIEKLGIKPLEQILEANGGWPMIMEKSEWNSRNVSWKKIHENYHLLSRNASLFTVWVDADLHRNVNVIKLKQRTPMFPLDMQFALEEGRNARSYYAKYVEDVALTFAKSRNSNVSRKRISKDIADMIDFEGYLYELSFYMPNDYSFISSTDSLHEMYNEELTRSGKAEINWLKTFQNLFGDVGIRVRKTDTILLSNPVFIRRLAHILEETSKRTIVNYLHWKFVSAMMPYTNKKMRNMNYSLNKFISGVTEQKPRWEECISENPVKDALSYQIVHKYLLKKSKEKVLDMVKEIQDQAEIKISNTNWRDKSEAKKGLWNTAKFIGFSDWFNNASASIEFYKDLRVGPSYFDNILNYNKFTLRKNLKKLRQPIDNTWLVDPFTVNIYRDFIKNSLIFPAAVHQLPLFGASRPNAVNYGAIGTIIGHELLEPFIDYGNTILEHVCYLANLINYEKKVFETLNVTDYEESYIIHYGTIIDNAGLQTAYEAYQRKLAAERITEDKLPGLENFSSGQIFFLSFANNWCESLKREKPFDNDLTSQKISVGRLRVIGSVSNTPEFSEAFQCPKGRPMNPEYKCTFWKRKVFPISEEELRKGWYRARSLRQELLHQAHHSPRSLWEHRDGVESLLKITAEHCGQALSSSQSLKVIDELLCSPQYVSGPRRIRFSKTFTEMLLLHSIIVLGALLVSSRARSNPYIIVAQPEQEESNDIPGLSEEVRTEDLVKTNDAKVCQTEECRLIGQEFLRNLNKSVDPCEDFYEYACGGWRANNPIPVTESSWNRFSVTAKSNDKRIRAILEEPEEDTDIAPVKAAKQFYRSCMNLEALEEMGLKPLEIILEENGGWPMTRGSSESKSSEISWQQIHDNYSRIRGQAILYSFRTRKISNNVYRFVLSPANFILPRSMLVRHKQYKTQTLAYAKYVGEVALAFAKSRNSHVRLKEIYKDVADLINFEIKLAEMKFPKNMRLIPISRLKTIYYSKRRTSANKEVTKSLSNSIIRCSHMLSIYLQIDWVKSIKILFNEANIQVRDTDMVLCPDKQYFSKIIGVLQKTPERTIVNYLHWRFVNVMLHFTNEKMRNLLFEFRRTLFGTEKQQPRWQQCVSENLLKDAVSYKFGQKYFSKESKKKVFEMVKEIKEKIEIEISLANFINNDTKSEAIRKLRDITLLIGVPDWYTNVSAIVDFYKSLEVGLSYFHNVLNYNNFLMKKNLSKMRQQVDYTEWFVDPTTVNAAYNPLDNSIILPAAILQPLFFSTSQPNPVNYGGIGTLIGHEISHAYNKFEREHNRNKCFVDQFNKYRIKELEKFNDTNFQIGEITQDENIPDSAGLQAAYEAHQSKLAAEGIIENKVPGLEDFSSQQIFFLSFANNWCESVRPKRLSYDILTRQHTIGRLRVIGSVSNTPGFSKAFQCPAGSPMNPEVKCTLWDL